MVFLSSAGLPQGSGTGLSAALGVTDILVKILIEHSKSSEANKEVDSVKDLPIGQYREDFALFPCTSDLFCFIC